MVFVAGLGHSGTTLTEMLLTRRPSICGLGETWFYVSDTKNRRLAEGPATRRCSCGSSVEDCPVWGPYLGWWRRHPSSTYTERYRRLIDIVATTDPHSEVLVDSSKYVDPLRSIAAALDSGDLGNLELVVVHVVKDVRGWVESQQRRRGGGTIRAARAFRRWRHGNEELASSIRQARPARHLTISYEDLCFDTDATVARLCDAVGVEATAGMDRPESGHGHLGFGNRMRLDPVTSSALRYDSRWMTRVGLGALYALFPGVRRANEALVYGRLDSHDPFDVKLARRSGHRDQRNR